MKRVIQAIMILLICWILSLGIMFGVAAVAYKCGWNIERVSIAVWIIYGIASVIAGIIVGKITEKKRLIMGIIMGGVYGVSIVLVSLVIGGWIHISMAKICICMLECIFFGGIGVFFS